MEVICIDDNWAPVINGDKMPAILPKKDETYLIIEVVKSNYFDNGIGYVLEGFTEKINNLTPLFDSSHFTDISNLQDQINEALKAKNPNIKKYPLRELEEIGYISKEAHEGDIFPKREIYKPLKK